jgi:hypothetical protein
MQRVICSASARRLLAIALAASVVIGCVVVLISYAEGLL